MSRKKQPKIIISWPYCDEDHIAYAKALKDLGIIDGYVLSEDKLGLFLISYRDKVVITPENLEEMFEMTIGFSPKEIIRETWFEAFANIKKGKITRYTENEVVIESSE